MQALAPSAAQRLLRSYLAAVARIGGSRLERPDRRDATLVRRTLTYLVRYLATGVALTAVVNDVGGGGEAPCIPHAREAPPALPSSEHCGATISRPHGYETKTAFLRVSFAKLRSRWQMPRRGA